MASAGDGETGKKRLLHCCTCKVAERWAERRKKATTSDESKSKKALGRDAEMHFHFFYRFHVKFYALPLVGLIASPLIYARREFIHLSLQVPSRTLQIELF